ncbi:MAG: MarR family transcriptional regulator [Chloroflexi bacterium]|nr:MarR family transcriptional regulator [Chloroflexota bacterium]
MSEPTLPAQTERAMEVLRDFVRMKHRLIPALPDDLARAKERLDRQHLGDKPGEMPRYGVCHRLCVVLSGQSEPLAMGELSEALDVPMSTATRLVDWLVESGYAERLPDARDRRVVRVGLTKMGLEFYQSMEEFVRQHVQRILGGFTPEEREDLIRLLGKLMKVMERCQE